MARQVSWAAEQAAGLQEFFRRKDPAAVVNGGLAGARLTRMPTRDPTRTTT